MITGFLSIAEENKNKVYDYAGCLYPEGMLSSNQTCLFDHNQIDKIYFLGYRDEEAINFMKQLKEIEKTQNVMKPKSETNSTSNIPNIEF